MATCSGLIAGARIHLPELPARYAGPIATVTIAAGSQLAA